MVIIIIFVLCFLSGVVSLFRCDKSISAIKASQRSAVAKAEIEYSGQVCNSSFSRFSSVTNEKMPALQAFFHHRFLVQNNVFSNYFVYILAIINNSNTMVVRMANSSTATFNLAIIASALWAFTTLSSRSSLVLLALLPCFIIRSAA